MKFFYFLALLPFFYGQVESAQVLNQDISVPCSLEIEYKSGEKTEVEIPPVGKSIEVDLTGENIIRMTCPSYGGGSTEKTFCVVKHSMDIKTLKLFNRPDVFGDGPACKAE